MKVNKTAIKDYWELTKPGVTLMVVISTLGGFYLGTKEGLLWSLLLHTLIGSWLVAAGTSALNQLVEKDLDALMKRTRNRPLPAGRLTSLEVGTFATTISVIGIVYLVMAVNVLTGALATLTMASYVLIYTPMKRKTHLSTMIGAIPGALPAMGGWAAVRGEITIEAWILFAILFFWQLPHFLAIAWLYKEDYARGGFPVLPVVQPDGVNTGMQIIGNTLALLSVSLLPTLLGLTGPVYFFGAFSLGIVFLIYGIQVAINKSNRYARRLLLASIAYLPLLYVLMFIDKTPL